MVHATVRLRANGRALAIFAIRLWIITWCGLTASTSNAQAPTKPPGDTRVSTLGAIERIYPAEGTNNIADFQHFALKFREPIKRETLKDNLYCEATNIGERVGARLLNPQERAAILKAAGVTESPEWLTIACLQRFPYRANVTLSVLPDIQFASGTKLARESKAYFTVWGDTGFKIECARENPRTDCIPFKPISVRFDSEIDPKDKDKIQLRSADGKVIRPYKSRSSEDPFAHDPTIDVIFYETLPENARFELILPDSLRDRQGRPVGIKDGMQRERTIVRTGEYPPLVKFSGRFGIVERNADGLLPVTLRNLENAPAAKAGDASSATHGAKLKTLHVVRDEDIINTMSRLEAFFGGAGGSEGDEAVDAEEVTPSGERRQRDRRTRSFLATEKGAQTAPLPKPLGAKEFEVVGLPLAKAGLHVVEIESRKLGLSLTRDRRPMFVQSAALLTNLSVHFKRGQDNALAWVTTLDKGEAVAGATVSLRDCKAKELAKGVTNRDGVWLLERALGEVNWECPWYVVARLGDDVSFVRSNWNEGIETWRFNLPEASASESTILHTIFDRMLLKPGETVSMKHVARRDSNEGLKFPQVAKLAKSLELVHVGTGDRQTIELKWDARGIAESSWKIPPGVKQGVYEAMIGGQVTGSLRIGEFRVPLMKGEVNYPRFQSVQPRSVAVDLALAYLAGGPAANGKVKLRNRMLPKALTFDGFDGFNFGDTVGIFDEAGTVQVSDQPDDGTWAGSWRGSRAATRDREAINIEDQELTLDAKGVRRAEIRGWNKLKAPKTLVTEMEFADPNGEIQTVSARTAIWNAGLVLGMKGESWVARAGEPFRYQVLALDTNGKPVAGVDVQTDTRLKIVTSHRRRSVGGTYTYDNRESVRKLAASCGGKTDNRGLVTCQVTPDVSGNILLATRAKDSLGNAVGASLDIWVAGRDEWWFAQENHDRMDVLPDKRRYTPGDTAKLQVRMPFREALGLVTLERGSVLEYRVVKLGGKEPMVDLPIRPTWSPNVYASVLAVRGRVGDPKPTALVDLAKPAFKLGIASFDVDAGASQLKVQVSTDRSVYQTREKAQVKVRVSRSDGKPLPEGSEVAIAAVDEGLLELLPNSSWDIVSGLYKRRGYGVETASAQMHVVGRRHFGKKALPPGGGGGKSPTREMFDTLLKWQGRLVLDKNGEGQLEVPINDSLTRFRITAVATAGENFFGNGSTAITATKDLQILSGLPIVVREGDRFTVRLTARNTTQQPLNARVEMEGAPSAEAPKGTAPPTFAKITQTAKTITLKAGEATDVLWDAVVPNDATSIVWLFNAKAENNRASDSLRITQRVASATPLRIIAQDNIEVAEPGKPFTRPIALPASAVAGRGQIRVLVTPSLNASTEGIARYMQSYPFWCLEQRTSKAVALKDARLWQVIADALPTYLDDDGLADYFPSATAFSRGGWPNLTAYVLNAADEAGFTLPPTARDRMERGLIAYVEGRAKRDRSYIKDPEYDVLQRLSALSALARTNKVTDKHLETIRPRLAEWDMSALLDWVSVLQRQRGLANRDARLADAVAELRNRVNFNGSADVFKGRSAQESGRWWMMHSRDVDAVRLLLVAADLPAWKDDLTLIARSALARQVEGRYLLTTANVWGRLAFDKFARAVSQGGTSGATAVVLGGQTRVVDWTKQPNGGELVFDWPTVPGAIAVAHEGMGKPWAAVIQIAAMRVTEPLNRGFDLKKTITPVEQRKPGQWSRGDIAKVTLEFAPKDANGWVVIEDPVPPGSTILGSGLGRDSQLASTNTRDNVWLRPLYIERTFEAYRAYYEHLWPGIRKVEYSVRFNNEGSFDLPRTHIEAMYQPERFAVVPNTRVEVRP
jgi:alpha-2-macroglobulin